MKPAAPRRAKRLEIETSQGHAASLHRESQFVTRYAEVALAQPQLALSLTMPPRPEGYRANTVPPVLAMNLPEGFLLDRVANLYRKAMDVDDDMNLLALTSTPNAGRVWARLPEGGGESLATGKAVQLSELLATGTEALFADLVDRYALATPISGVQPKVVVPGAVGEKSRVHTPDLIVKAAGTEYPGLAENEFLCMQMARHAGLDVPQCWLSEDRGLFVIRRFDIAPGGGYLGFEDLACLTGRNPRAKYEGGYASVAQALADFCAPAHRADSLDRFFRQLVFCCLVRNGDAHLKNWGLLYGDPASADHDARLSPVYDLVCTKAWIKGDVLALGLNGTKAWPDRCTLERFGQSACGLVAPGRLIDEIVDRSFAFEPREKTPMWRTIRREMKAAAATLEK